MGIRLVVPISLNVISHGALQTWKWNVLDKVSLVEVHLHRSLKKIAHMKKSSRQLNQDCSHSFEGVRNELPV